MRPCPTCQCFVPVAAHQCPRCSAALEPIEVSEEVERDLVLVGARNGSSPPAGSGSDDPVTRSVLAHVMLPPIDGPAGRPPRPSLPKLPQPYAPDPLVLAVFLGIPVVEPETDPEPEAHAEPETHAEPEARAEPEPIEPEPAAIEPAPEVDEDPGLSPDTFSALLGIPRQDPPPVPRTAARPRAPIPPPAPALVAVPVATTTVRTAALVAPRRRRLFSHHDPFARTSTRRERVLTRLCLLLVLALAGAVVVLRLPVGARPVLESVGARDGVSTPVTRSADPDSLQARHDLRDTLTVAYEVYPDRNTYRAATPAVLNDSLPDLAFVSGTRTSRRIGEISVSASTDRIVLAEAAKPRECTFARVVGRESPEAAVLTNGKPCRASDAPTTGWTALGTD